ncbi:MAG TPA: DUF4833 domain-containing protein [Paracoccaceae bacterium]|nr:DUF4833 domain-containing protein [Paracoccaceae bacterium]
MQTAPERRRLAPAACAQRQLGRLLLLLALPILLLAPPQAQAAELRLVGVTAAGQPPAPEYPVPNDAGMVLYMQRSTNPNTVVYAARFGADGRLDQKDPITAYWRRFNTDGHVKDLSTIERRMAYGVTSSRREPGVFDVRFRAIPDIPLVLEQRGPGQAVLTFAPKGQAIDLTYGYLEVDESGLIPSVTGIKLFGQRRADGQPVQVTYSVRRGEITSGANR